MLGLGKRRPADLGVVPDPCAEDEKLRLFTLYNHGWIIAPIVFGHYTFNRRFSRSQLEMTCWYRSDS